MRIIAGALRGRRLVTPSGRDTRPTADRVREALFSTLGDVAGDRVVDLYAGSGSLGLEALSRGGEHAVFVERAAAAIQALTSNVTALGVGDRCTVLRADVARVSKRLVGPFALWLVDPPYRDLPRLGRLLPPLLQAHAGADARIVVEHAARDDMIPIASAELERTRRYGDTALSFLRWRSPG